MTESLVYLSRIQLLSRDGLHLAYVGEATEPVVYGSDETPALYTGGGTGLPVISPLDHMVSAIAV